MGPIASVTFYFDLGSPYAYLAASRLQDVVPGPVRWQPVLLGGLFKLTGRTSWALGDYRRRQTGMADIERRARGYGLPPLRWPDPWPTDYLGAMRAATYAFTVGAGVEFALAAFRHAFVAGADLSRFAHVRYAGRAVGIDPAELTAAVDDPQVKRALRAATEDAYERGVIGVPTLAVDGELFWGDDRLEEAAVEVSPSGGAGAAARRSG
jgi:2-hydroxychromene-2-carboxylate isomerase